MKCQIKQAWPNFLASLSIDGQTEKNEYIKGQMMNGSYSLLLIKAVKVTSKKSGETVEIQCTVLWMKGENTETIISQRSVKLQGELHVIYIYLYYSASYSFFNTSI